MKGYEVLIFSGSDPALLPFKNMIYAFWKKSLRDGNDWFNDIDENIYHQVYTGVIDHLLKRPMALVKLAVLPDDLDTCLGFSVCEESTLHYVFIKAGIAARQQGIATDLLPQDFKQISHLTKIGREIWKKKYPNIKFNPFC